jgi:hypothetical protein
MLRDLTVRPLLVFDLRRKMTLGAIALTWLAVATVVGLPDTWRHAGMVGAFTDIVMAITMFIVAAGIFTRRRFGWRMGFGLIGASAMSYCWEFPAMAAEFEYHPALVWGSSAAFLAVAIGWTIVWYRQRHYFFERDPENA